MTLRKAGLIAISAVLVVSAAQPNPLRADNLTDLLKEVGETYAQAYASPFIYAHGVNQNSGLYHTADLAGTGFHLSIGLKMMATQLAEGDQYFRKVLEDVPLGQLLPDDPVYDFWRDQTGDVVMEGPTLFGPTGDASAGKMTAYVNGIPVYTVDTIPGVVESRWEPLFAPQATIGRVFGLSANVRYFPEVEISSYGRTKFFGWGLTWGANTIFPMLPFDVAIGYFNQELDVGNMLETDARSVYLSVSKSLSFVTLYGGYARESSSMKVTYYFEGYEDDVVTVEPTEVGFDVGVTGRCDDTAIASRLLRRGLTMGRATYAAGRADVSIAVRGRTA